MAMTSSTQIVPFEAKHRLGFVQLVTETLIEFGFVVDPVLDTDLADPAASYDAVWVAVDAAQVVGSVAMRRSGRDAAELKRMYLLPAHRGHRLGRALLDTALNWAIAQGVQKVRLDTAEHMTAARTLYQTVGFRQSGQRTETGAHDSRCELLYHLELPPSSNAMP
jgi:putative acetyltransferase